MRLLSQQKIQSALEFHQIYQFDEMMNEMHKISAKKHGIVYN